MNATLITAGIACIIAAIIGGGLKAFAIEIRVLDSGRRQAALGAFGVLLLGAGLPLNSFLPTATIRSSSGSTKDQLNRIRMAGPTLDGAPTAATTLSPGQRSPSTDECRPWFGNPPPDRVAVIESGAADAEVLAADKPKDRPVVVVVTEDGKPVGAVAFKVYEGNALFKITQVVNARCEPLDSFRNESRGGDRHVLQNYDTVELTFGTLKYTLRLGFDSGSIEGQLHRV